MLLLLLCKKESSSFAGSFMCSNPFFYIRVYRGFLMFFFPPSCAGPLSLTKAFFTIAGLGPKLETCSSSTSKMETRGSFDANLILSILLSCHF